MKTDKHSRCHGDPLLPPYTVKVNGTKGTEKVSVWITAKSERAAIRQAQAQGITVSGTVVCKK